MTGTTVAVRPASARGESLAVAALCLTIITAATGFIAFGGRTDDTRSLAAWQIDARSDLRPAEQGLLADLTIAAGEIAWLTDGSDLPPVAAIADEGIPPFAPSASDALRGGHDWSLEDGAYLGRSASLDLAGSFLMIPGDPPAIWLYAGTPNVTPADRSDQGLADSGWRLIVSHYDASVTRHGAHDGVGE